MHRVTGKLIFWTAFLFATDQLTKVLARTWLSQADTIELLPFLKLERIQNRGIAFGMLDGYEGIILFIGVIIVAALVLGAVAVRKNEQLVFPVAFLLAGSAGNLIDRLRIGSVTDFLRLPHWPAFNLADVYILAGVSLMVLKLVILPEWRSYRSRRRST